jgi:hypothetical protein
VTREMLRFFLEHSLEAESDITARSDRQAPLRRDYQAKEAMCPTGEVASRWLRAQIRHS